MTYQPTPVDLPELEDLPIFDSEPQPQPATPARRTTTATSPEPATVTRGRPVDWKTVAQLRDEAAGILAAQTSDLGSDLSPEDRKERGRAIVSDLVRDHSARLVNSGAAAPTSDEERLLAQAVMEALFGFGRLQPLIDNPEVENIEIYGDRVILQTIDSDFLEADPVADSDEDLLSMLTFMANQQGRSFDRNHPRLHMTLGRSARLQAIGWISERPIVTIRIHRLIDIDLDDLVNFELFDTHLARFLSAAVRARKSIIVAGAQSSGKTTLLRALLNEIDPWEKILTLESTYELHLDKLGPERHQRLISLEAVPGSDEKDIYGRPIGEITMDDLARDSFRMNLDRMVVGEILGPEVVAMFEAMQTGAGSLSTIHSKSASGVEGRIITLARKDGRVTEDFTRRQVAENVDLVVYISVSNPFGRRKLRRVTHVESYEPGENGQVAKNRIYGPGANGAVVPVTPPDWLEDLAEAGYPAEAFMRGVSA